MKTISTNEVEFEKINSVEMEDERYLNCKRKLEIAAAIPNFSAGRVFAGFGEADSSSFSHGFFGIDVNGIQNVPFLYAG